MSNINKETCKFKINESEQKIIELENKINEANKKDEKLGNTVSYMTVICYLVHVLGFALQNSLIVMGALSTLLVGVLSIAFMKMKLDKKKDFYQKEITNFNKLIEIYKQELSKENTSMEEIPIQLNKNKENIISSKSKNNYNKTIKRG